MAVTAFILRLSQPMAMPVILLVAAAAAATWVAPFLRDWVALAVAATAVLVEAQVPVQTAGTG